MALKRLTVALTAVALTMTLAGATALGRQAHPDPSGVTALDGSGRQLPHDPLLHPGERVVLAAGGFAPTARIQVRALIGTEYVQADSHGVATYRFAVPVHIGDGSHVVRLIGAPRLVGQPTPPPGNVDVVVPRLVEFGFRTGGSGVGGVSTGPSGSGGSLAETGFDILAALALSALLVALGGAAVLAVRRRRSARG